MIPQFEVGDKVICDLPDEIGDLNDPDYFNAGWDDDMEECVGKTGKIKIVGDVVCGRHDYYVRFENDEWWWDERCMRLADEISGPLIEENDFNDILN